MIDIFILFTLYNTCVNNAWQSFSNCADYAHSRGVHQDETCLEETIYYMDLAKRGKYK